MFARFMNSRVAMLVSAGFLALVLLAGASLPLSVFLRDDPGGHDTGPPPPSPAPPSSGCPRTADPAPLTSPPADVQWQLVGPVKLPFSPTAGPCRVTSTTGTQYAHTPTGALIAAAQTTGRMSVGRPLEVATSAINDQVLAGPARDQLLAATKARADKPLDPSAAGHVTAYAVTSYSADTAVINLALTGEATTGQYVVLPVTLR